MNGEQCPFCKIASGEIPSRKIFEDSVSVGVLDIAPAGRGHTLVISKKHYIFLHQMPPEEVSAMFNSIKFLSVALMQALGATGVNVVYNLGPGAGQKVPHVHVHLIPRFPDDKLNFSWEAKKFDDSAMNEIHTKIISFLSGALKPQVQPAPQPAAPLEEKLEEKELEKKQEKPKEEERAPRRRVP